jgi:hypothetical protein
MIDTDEFIQQLIKKAMPNVEEEDIQTMIEDTQPILYDRVISNIMEQIEEKDREKILDTLETKGVTAEVTEYLTSKIPNFPEFMEKTYNEFETMYLENFKKFDEEFKDEDLIDTDEDEIEKK